VSAPEREVADLLRVRLDLRERLRHLLDVRAIREEHRVSQQQRGPAGLLDRRTARILEIDGATVVLTIDAASERRSRSGWNTAGDRAGLIPGWNGTLGRERLGERRRGARECRGSYRNR
jgi:hypothetical protein